MAKQDKSSRQAVIDEIRGKQKSAERRRGGMILGVAVLLGLLIIGAAAYKPVMDWWELRSFKGMDLQEIGAPASSCQKIKTEKAEGNQDHVPVGTPMSYPDSPPAFGQHWDDWESMGRKLYSAGDRPELGELVHNLEHGYTILWYDETAAEDEAMMDDIRGIAAKFDGNDRNLRNKFKAVPWTSEDGDPFPEGQHVAITHWSIGGADADPSDASTQKGVWQYCSAPSGEALEDFMLEYPYLDSPEPGVV